MRDGRALGSQKAQPLRGQAWDRGRLGSASPGRDMDVWAALGRCRQRDGRRGRCRLTGRRPRCLAAVQEERQRGKDRNENEVESTSSANEDMPVEKILEAELAVEPKTETYVEANMGLNPNSVSVPRPLGLPLRWQGPALFWGLLALASAPG